MNKPVPRAKYARKPSALGNALKAELYAKVQAYIKMHGFGSRKRFCAQLGITNSGELKRIFSEKSNITLRIFQLIAEQLGETLILVPIYAAPKISAEIPDNLKQAIEHAHNPT